MPELPGRFGVLTVEGLEVVELRELRTEQMIRLQPIDVFVPSGGPDLLDPLLDLRLLFRIRLFDNVTDSYADTSLSGRSAAAIGCG
jgi:hypothetical protein